MANHKPLVIKVKDKAIPNVKEKEWTQVSSMSNLTKDIITPQIDENNTNIGAIVTGIPTVFARANIIKLSLGYITDSAAETSGLMSFYKSIVDEWRGFIACIALEYQHISVERIYLKYSDGKGLKDTANIYEPKGAFGNMLFERKPLWCEQGISNNEENAGVPFIDVIKYKNNIVGGTSPDSFLFTSNTYSIEGQVSSFINNKSKKSTDPIQNAKLNAVEISQLFGYIERIISKIEDLENYYSELDSFIRPNYEAIKGNLNAWKEEIDNYAQSNGIAIKPNIPPVDKFAKPFSIIFNFASELYGSEGIISENADGLEEPIFFDPQQLLLDDNSEIARIEFNIDTKKNPAKIKEQPVFVLTAQVKGMESFYEYFALPLSPLGLNVFGNNLGTIVGIDDNSTIIKTRLTAEFDPKDSYLEVTMHLFMQEGQTKTLKKKYKVGHRAIQGNDILLWPDFISKQWGRYFMYSEIPHNVDTPNCPFKAIPFVGDTDDSFFRFLADQNNAPLFLAKEGKIAIPKELENKVQARMHVVADNRVADNSYKYEIYESTLPFKGVKLMTALKESGYIIIRYPAAQNYLQEVKHLSKARLGIDFGSSNTAVAYYSEANNSIVDQIVFKNRRLSLLANDDKDNSQNAAVEDEIFFFQNDEIKSNAIKSRLTIHNRKRLVQDNETTEATLLAQAVKGGFPNFEKNLPIDRVTGNRIVLSYPKSGSAEIIHNMKWSSQDIENAYKTAYLGSLLLHIYAQLFEEGHYPAQLKWSYPSSMGLSLIRQYSTIWNRLNEVNPLINKNDYTLAVLNPRSTMHIDSGNANVFGQNQSNNGWNGQAAQPQMAWGNSAQGNTFGTAAGNNMWGTPQPATNGFNVPAQSNGWNNAPAQSKAIDIKVETEPIKFNFQPLNDNECLTEACAVANYIANQSKVDTTPGHLTLCFDVGGSTTDISALCQMKRADNGFGLAMVKQNSIRFAAQRVATATKYSPNFKSVLLELCEQKGIKIQGLNAGASKFSPETAPYYFGQIVDRINDADFHSFYQLINGKCLELMSVNLYVTGLIMFYAGQLAYKLIKEIRKSEDRIPGFENGPYSISIVFAGKGARIFDWLKITNPQVYHDYYTQQFIAGFGGLETAQQILSRPPEINPTNEDTSNIKYEVSKGLAYYTRDILVPQNNEAIEILGEDGFVIIKPNGERIPLPYECSLTNEMMEHTGTYFMSAIQPGQQPCPKFMDFAGIFFQIAISLYGLKMTQQDFMNGFNGMNINSYITTLPEYYAAQATQKETQKFDFVAPIIILEGMKFYDDYLLKGIAK